MALIKDATFARSTRRTDEINSTHGGCFCGRRKVATKLAVPNCTSLRMDPAGWLVGWLVGRLEAPTESPARFLVITVPGIPAQRPAYAARRRDVSGPRHQCDTGDKSGTIVERDGAG